MRKFFFLNFIRNCYSHYIFFNSLIKYYLMVFYITIYLYCLLLNYYIIYIIKAVHSFNNIYYGTNYYFFLYKILCNRSHSTLHLIKKYLYITRNYRNKFYQLYTTIKSILIKLVKNFNKITLIKQTINICLIRITKYFKLNNELFVFRVPNFSKNCNLLYYKQLIIIIVSSIIFFIILSLSEFIFFLACANLCTWSSFWYWALASVVVYFNYWIQNIDVMLINLILYFTEVFKTSLEDRSSLVKILSIADDWSFIWYGHNYLEFFIRHYTNSMLFYLNYWLWLKQNVSNAVICTNLLIPYFPLLEQCSNFLAFFNILDAKQSLFVDYNFCLWGGFPFMQISVQFGFSILQNLNWLCLLGPHLKFLVAVSSEQFFSYFGMCSDMVCLLLDAHVVCWLLVAVVTDSVNQCFYVLFNFYVFLLDLCYLNILQVFDWFLFGSLLSHQFLVNDFLFFTACGFYFNKILTPFVLFFILDCVPYFSAWYAYGLLSILPNFSAFWGFTFVVKCALFELCEVFDWAFLTIFSGGIGLVDVVGFHMIASIVAVCAAPLLDALNVFSSLLLLCLSVEILNSSVITIAYVISSVLGGTFLVLPSVILWYYLASFVFFGGVTSAISYFFFRRTHFLSVSRISKLISQRVGLVTSWNGVADVQEVVLGGKYYAKHPDHILTRSSQVGRLWPIIGLLVQFSRARCADLLVGRSNLRGSDPRFLFNLLCLNCALRAWVSGITNYTGSRLTLPTNMNSEKLPAKLLNYTIVLLFLALKGGIKFYLLSFLVVKNYVSGFLGSSSRCHLRSIHRHLAMSEANAFVIDKATTTYTFQMFSLIMSLPLFLMSLMVDFFFWVTGFTAARLQFFSSHLVGVSEDLHLGVTFNSRLLRELGGSSLKFSSENFSAISVASRYFLFVDRHRPAFLNLEVAVKDLPAFSSGSSELARDVTAQYLKHTFFNALFAEHHYSYSSESSGAADNGYFSYVFSFIDTMFSGTLMKVDLIIAKLIVLPAFTIVWMLGYPYFEIYNSGFFSANPVGVASPLDTKNGAELVGRELMLLRFLVSNTFLNVTLSEIPVAKLLQTRAEWMSNQLFSWNWHYRWFAQWHSYAQRRSVRRLRGGVAREMMYIANPYRIFEQLPDMLFPGTVFTDDATFLKNFPHSRPFLGDTVAGCVIAQESFTSPTRALSKKMKYSVARREICRGGVLNGEVFRYIAPEWGYYRALNTGLILSGELANGILLRRYNAFFSDLVGQDKVSRLLGGVGTWSVGFVPHDYFFRWFYYRYWASKQSYYLKFMFYEKFQFFKRRKKRLVYDKMTHLRFWRRSVRLNHKKGLWRFNNYKRERLTRKLALFFYTLRSGFLDFWGENSLSVNRNFNLAYSVLNFNFNGLFDGDTLLLSGYGLFSVSPLFYNFVCLVDWLWRLALYRALQIFSFFLHTSIVPYYILPVELVAKVMADLFVKFKPPLKGIGPLSSQPAVFLYVCVGEAGGEARAQKNLFGPISKYCLEKQLLRVFEREIS